MLIQKPRPVGRNNNNDAHSSAPPTNLKKRHASVNLDRQGRLNPSPSKNYIRREQVTIESEDDFSPQKPIIMPDLNDSLPEHDILPILTQRHRSVAPPPMNLALRQRPHNEEFELHGGNSQVHIDSSPSLKMK